MRKKWNTPFVTAIGFFVLAAFVDGREIVAQGWDSEPIGYWLGTGIGAGILGGLLGFIISYSRNRNISNARS